MALFFKSKEEKQKEFDAKQERRLEKWLQNVEKTINGRTRKLNYVMEVERVTPTSDHETLAMFHDVFGHRVHYGAILLGEVHQCSFFAFLPFPCQNLILMRFEIPIQIDWEGSYVHRGSGFSTAGSWVCSPRNGRMAGQIE